MKVFYESYRKKWKTEIVERKGLGHPDTIADRIAETFSRNLLNYYLNNFGKILHYNVDKLQVVAGETEPQFGGGRVISPITIFFSGRATNKFNNKEIPIEKIARNSAVEFFDKNFRFVDLRNINSIVKTKGGAGNLKDIFNRKGIPSNDTSVGIGFAPMTDLEKNVIEIEKFLNSRRIKHRFQFLGEDIKVMGIRIRSKFEYTISIAFIDRFVHSENDYFDKKELIKENLGKKFEGKININVLDEKGRGTNGIYLTVTGTSLENGDDGAVGRGNRINGVIPYNRFYSLEAVAGKNPVNHVGKIYNVVALNIANDIYEKYGIENYVWLVSQSGRDIRNPWFVKIAAEKKMKFEKIINENLEKIPELTKKFVKGKVNLF